MCGIAGNFLSDNHNSVIFSLDQIMKKQHARGPDSGGIYSSDNLMLGHNRLKIFDLSEKAAQPMINQELGLVLVFNGEIYNFRELRKRLEQKGYNFKSTGDTEVLLKAYDAWGDHCLNLIEGMFAFAIWDEKRNKLLLARDRLGIKPLFYTEKPGTFSFASTLPALLQIKEINTDIDPEALHYYLTFHAIPEPLTLFKGIKKLPPGAVLSISADGKKEIKDYWKFNFANPVNYLRTEEEWLVHLEDTLKFSIKRQFSADVPVGIFLSGGLDSSLLVALTSQLTDKQLNTFSIGFSACNDEKGDEFVYSDRIAQQFNTRHYKFLVSNDDIDTSLANCIASMSEPMVSHDNIAFYLLAQEASKHVKVVLSGQGADEIFAGYHWFQKLPQQSASFARSADLILDLIADRNFKEYKQLVNKNYLTSNLSRDFLINLCSKSGTDNPVEQLMLYESTFALANGPLSRVDNMTMSSSLEARVPFLDERIINLALSMPLKFKLQGNGKYIMKCLAKKMLSEDIINRPKGYFPVPAIKHLQGNISTLIREMLSPKVIEQRGIFNPEYIKTMKENSFTSTGGSTLWQIALLEYWLQLQNL